MLDECQKPLLLISSRERFLTKARVEATFLTPWALAESRLNKQDQLLDPNGMFLEDKGFRERG